MDFTRLLQFDFTLPFWIITGSLFLFFAIQALYYLLVYREPYLYAKRANDLSAADNLPGVSVIIASMNESENLARNLPVILEQNYPDFEVVVVNMGSTDETDLLLKTLGRQYPNLYHTYVPANAEAVNEKKLALTLGVKAARYDYLLFTEAYCVPETSNWIESFGKEFSKGAEVVLGFCKLVIGKRTALRRFILYDNMFQGIKYLSSALLSKPFMGIGRNLGYRKSIFFEEKGYSSLLNVDDGEDDLFVNRIARKKRVGVTVSPASMTRSDVVDGFFVWRTLKSKYLRTRQYYKGCSSLFFGFETFSRYLFYLSFAGGMVYGYLSGNCPVALLALLLLVVRFVIQLVVLNRNARLFGAERMHLNLLFFDIYQPINDHFFAKYANRRSRSKR